MAIKVVFCFLVLCVVFAASVMPCTHWSHCETNECIAVVKWNFVSLIGCKDQICTYVTPNNEFANCPDVNCTADAGSYCNAYSIRNPCPANYYCTGDTAITACPTGTISPANSPNSASCYFPCSAPAGSYCKPGSSTITACPANSSCTGGRAISTCPAGMISLANSTSSTPCHLPCSAPAGSYCLPETGLTIACPTNSYCTGLTAIAACPTGTISPANSTSSASCLPCPKGTYLPTNNPSADFCLNCSRPIEVGEFEWNDNGTCTFQCLPGFYKVDSGFGWICLECTRNASCESGSYATPTCVPWGTKDSECVACPAKPLETKWVSVCDFVCSSTSKYFNRTTSTCNTCSKPKCAPGWNATACTNENDPTCERCQNGPLNGPYTWTDDGVCVFACEGAAYFNETNNRTCQTCEAGTYRSSNTTCSKCSTTQCAAGTYRTQCNTGETSNSVCAACQNPPDGAFTWTEGCNFTCNMGNFYIDNKCSPCSVCPPGTRTTIQCNATADTVCTECRNSPVSGMFNWTSECSFVCGDGLYYSTALNKCLMCNIPNCTLGTTANPCTDSDNNPQCIACPNTPHGAEFTWKEGCDFQCKAGTYFNNNANECIQCNRPECPPGQYAPQCTNQINNPTCTACPSEPSSGPFKWTSGCNFTCTNGTYLLSSGYKCIPCGAGDYLSSSGCSACTTTKCPPGHYRTHCAAGSVQDAKCLPCQTPVTGPFSWTSQCAFACTNQTYLNNTHCTSCTPQCPDGSFIHSKCNATSDTVCRKCDVMPRPQGSFNWTEGCNFRCVAGMVWNSTHCVEEATVSMVVVKSQANMRFNNTVKEVCDNSESLIKAMNNALKQLYEVAFTSNISSINNETVQSACRSPNTTSRRRLLQDTGTDVVTESRASESITKGKADSVEQTIQNAQVIEEIARTTPTLNAQTVNVSTQSDPLPVPEDIKQPTNMLNWLLPMIFVLILVSFVLSILCNFKKSPTTQIESKSIFKGWLNHTDAGPQYTKLHPDHKSPPP